MFQSPTSSFVVIALAMMLGIGLGVSCTKATGRQIVHAADVICVIVDVTSDPGSPEERICATEDDLSPIVSEWLKAKRAKAAFLKIDSGVDAHE